MRNVSETLPQEEFTLLQEDSARFYEDWMDLGGWVKEHAIWSLEEGNLNEAVQIFKKGYEYLKKVSNKYIEKKFTPEMQKEFG